MKPNESSSGSSSDATSATAPAKPATPGQPRRDKAGDAGKAPASESEYLAQQAEDAKLAMSRALADLKHSLASGADVRLWTKRYPWLATSTALAAGVALGYFLTPRDRDEFKEMWEKLKDKLTGAGADPNAVYVEANSGKAAQAQAQPSLLNTLVREAMKAVVPLVTTLAGSAVGSTAGAQAASDNGHHGDEPNPS